MPGTTARLGRGHTGVPAVTCEAPPRPQSRTRLVRASCHMRAFLGAASTHTYTLPSVARRRASASSELPRRPRHQRSTGQPEYREPLTPRRPRTLMALLGRRRTGVRPVAARPCIWAAQVGRHGRGQCNAAAKDRVRVTSQRAAIATARARCVPPLVRGRCGGPRHRRQRCRHRGTRGCPAAARSRGGNGGSRGDSAQTAGDRGGRGCSCRSHRPCHRSGGAG